MKIGKIESKVSRDPITYKMLLTFLQKYATMGVMASFSYSILMSRTDFLSLLSSRDSCVLARRTHDNVMIKEWKVGSCYET